MTAPRGRETRPTADRVREAVFDLLGPGGVSGIALDLFAGSGALGLEALSRGAVRAVLVDRDPAALAVCRANARVLDDGGASVQVVRSEATAFLRRGGRGLEADLVFLDPPYAFERWDELLELLRGCQAVRPGGMVVRERATRTDPGVPGGYGVVRSARYGDTTVDLLQVEASGSTGDAPSAAPVEASLERDALYPGSFDPITNGHLGLIHRALHCFDHLIVAVAHNVRKSTLFTPEERIAMIREAVNGDPRVEVVSFEGLLVDYARKRNVKVVLRGLRAVADFEYELQMANMNRKLWPGMETFFMMTEEDYFFVSSRNVKEISLLGGDVSALVPAGVVQRLKDKSGGPA